MTLRYEADVDLPALAAELGVKPEQLARHLAASENLVRNLGALRLPGATVSRAVVVQSYADLVRSLRLGVPFQPGAIGQSLPDNTGEIDPLEAQSNPANAAAIRPDGRLVAFASADKTVRLWDVEDNRDKRRCIGHTASVWCVAFSPDGSRLLSGGKDGNLRLWQVETGREVGKFEGHDDLVTCLAFAPNGQLALSGGFDGQVYLWDVKKGEKVTDFTFGASVKYVHQVAFAANGRQALVCADNRVFVIDAANGKVMQTLVGHTAAATCAVFSPDGRLVLSGGDDGALRLWEAESGKQVRVFQGHERGVRTVVFRADGRYALSGGCDATMRLWDMAGGKEISAFRVHTQPIIAATFRVDSRHTLSVSQDAVVRLWTIPEVSAK